MAELIQADWQEKWNRLREWLAGRGHVALLLSSQVSFSWLTGGRGHINLASEPSCAKWLVTADRLFLICNNIEQNRLQTEELPACPIEFRVFNWFDPDGEANVLQSLADEGITPIVHEQEVANELSKLRQPLTAGEQQRYRVLGLEVAEALESVCLNIKRGQTEWQAAAQLAEACLARGIEPVVNLVAADQRASMYRHPLPTNRSIEQYAMLVIGGRRHGLVVSATRLVHFGAIPETLRMKHRAVATVDATLHAETRPGARVSDIFRLACEQYAQLGYPDEWRQHHQGGMTGYVSREYRASLHSTEVVGVDQAFSWNPSIAGVKSEDTILVQADENEVLTRTGQFPELEVCYKDRKLTRPDLLIRPW